MKNHRIRKSRTVRSARLAISAVAAGAAVAVLGAGAAAGKAAPGLKGGKASYSHKAIRFERPRLRHHQLTIAGTDGSDKIEGQDGNDTLLFNGAAAAEHVELSANGNRLEFVRDLGNITMDTHRV